MVNTRYELDPEKVMASVRAKIAAYSEQLAARLDVERKYALKYLDDVARNRPTVWGQRVATMDEIVEVFASQIREERDRYSTAHVMHTRKGYVLQYGSESVEVTRSAGAFESFEKAADWFYRGGR